MYTHTEYKIKVSDSILSIHSIFYLVKKILLLLLYESSALSAMLMQELGIGSLPSKRSLHPGYGDTLAMCKRKDARRQTASTGPSLSLIWGQNKYLPLLNLFSFKSRSQWRFASRISKSRNKYQCNLSPSRSLHHTRFPAGVAGKAWFPELSLQFVVAHPINAEH